MKEKDIEPVPMTAKEIHDACTILEGRPGRIGKEIQDGLELVKKYPKSVSVFGSTKTTEGAPDYEKARNLTRKIVEQTGYAVVTGGSSGIMEAANRGAFEAKGDSIGLNIKLPHEETTNSYVTNMLAFHYFFTRKVSLAFSAEAYIYFPGGFGTLDEFFEILTLVKTRKIEKVPIILVGNRYWNPIDRIVREHLYEKFGTIDKRDMNLYTITEDESEIIDIIKNAPLRKED